MFDYLILQNNIENPTAMTIFIMVLFSFCLSALVVLTYEVTNKDINRPLHFLQSLALISIIAAMVMQAIGDSLARGLGMLGALSIIRFRTVLDNPRNITFMFASLAIGIACGVYGFLIAFVGTLAFCSAALILHFSPLGQVQELIGNLKLDINRDEQGKQEVEKIIKKHTSKFELEQYRFLPPKALKAVDIALMENTEVDIEMSREKRLELVYNIRLKRKANAWELTQRLEELDYVEDLRLRFNKQKVEL